MLQAWNVNTSELSLVYLSILITMIVTIVLRGKRNVSRSPPLPPGPRGLPVVGYLPFIKGKDLHRQFAQLAKVYGPIFKLYIGTKLFVVISSPSLAKEVLRDKDVTFANRSPNIGATIARMGEQDIVFENYNEEWRKRRKLLVSEMMSKKGLEDCTQALSKEVKKMMKQAYNSAGKPIDVGLLVLTTIMNTITSVIWGDTMEMIAGGKSFQAKYRDMVKEFLSLISAPNISDFFPLLARLDLQGLERRMKRASRKCEDVFDMGINHSLKIMNEEKIKEQKSSRTNFLKNLLQIKDENEGGNMSLTLAEIKGILMNILTGGTDTTSSTIEWAMAELIQNPDTMSKAQKELTSVVGLDNTVTLAHLPHLPYLNAILSETHRLHPGSALLVPRRPATTATVSNYTIPSHATIFINVYAIHRDPKIWQDPTQFRPERFLESDVDYSGKWFELLPFGSGRRMCPGIPVAERMTTMALAAMVHGFVWRLPEGVQNVDFADEHGILMKKSKPLVAVPSPRLNCAELY